jgi:hypothetical protein
VQAAGLELDRAPGGNDDSFGKRPHPHDPIGLGHLMDLDGSAGFAGTAQQAVRLAAPVLDHQIAPGDPGAGRGRPGPGMMDGERTGLVAMGERCRPEHQGKKGHDDAREPQVTVVVRDHAGR